MDITLNADLTTRKFTSPDGGTPEFPLFVAGDELRFKLRLWDRNAEGERVETKLFLKRLKANLGKTVKPPTGGTFMLNVAGGDTAPMGFDADDATMQVALSEAGAAEVTKPAACLWVAKTNVQDTQSAPSVIVAENKLSPLSFVRIRSYKEVGVWWLEIRLILTPVAWCDTHEVVLPAPPSVRRLREGGSDSSADDIKINELQSLTLPEDFRGTYTLKWDMRETGVLGIEDGVEQIAERLNAMWSDGKKRFSVTLVVANEAFIEFIGPLGDAAQELITTEVRSTEAGLPNFTMSLKRPTVYQSLRAVDSVEIPFEVELAAVETADDIEDADAVAQIITLKQPTGIILYDEGIYPELEASDAIDWAHPPAPKDYIAFTQDQIITGTQNYPQAVGDGAATEFEITHGLDTDMLAAVTVRENIAGGALLVHGVDYTVTIEDANNVTVTLIGVRASTPPSANALLIVIVSAGPVAAFQSHTHTQAQIIGLLEDMQAIGNRLTNIEDKVPTTPPTTPEVLGGDVTTFTLPESTDIVPGRWAPDMDLDAEIKTGANLPPRGNALLPAIHVPEWVQIGVVSTSDVPSSFVLSRAGFGSAPMPTEGRGIRMNGGNDVVNGKLMDTVDVDGDFITISSIDGPYVLEGDVIQTGWTIEMSLPIGTNTALLPGSMVAGSLYKATADILLPGGLGIRSSTVKSGAYFGCDGRLFYRVTRDITPDLTGTFSPTDFERELWMLPVSTRMLRASQRLSVDFELEIGLLNRLVAEENRSRCQWLLVIEHGTTSGQTTPAPTGENLSGIVWNSTPLFTHRFIVSESPMAGKFGVSLAWNGTIFTSKDVLSFGKWEAAEGDGPASNEFSLRARLVQFDAENSITTARGLVWHRTRNVTANVS